MLESCKVKDVDDEMSEEDDMLITVDVELPA
jgi:hypothetical protein